MDAVHMCVVGNGTMERLDCYRNVCVYITINHTIISLWDLTTLVVARVILVVLYNRTNNRRCRYSNETEYKLYGSPQNTRCVFINFYRQWRESGRSFRDGQNKIIPYDDRTIKRLINYQLPKRIIVTYQKNMCW